MYRSFCRCSEKSAKGRQGQYTTRNRSPWLADHILRGHVVFPAACCIAMAGEAVRQLNPGTEGFAAKNVLFMSPLVIDETGSVEIITSLKPVAFNDMMNSEWYSFVIASHDGSVWTEFCSGQVRAGAEHEPCQIKIPRYARQVSSENCMRLCQNLGFLMVPSFAVYRIFLPTR